MGKDAQKSVELTDEAKREFSKCVIALAACGFGEDGPPVDTTFAEIEGFGHEVGRMVARAVDESATVTMPPPIPHGITLHRSATPITACKHRSMHLPDIHFQLELCAEHPVHTLANEIDEAKNVRSCRPASCYYKVRMFIRDTGLPAAGTLQAGLVNQRSR